MMSRTEKLAKALLEDRNKVKPQHNIVPCFSCGATFVYKGRQGELNGRFCSMRCQAWFDDGNPNYEQQQELEHELLNAPLDSLVVVAGPADMVGRKPYADLFDTVAQTRGKPGETYPASPAKEHRPLFRQVGKRATVLWIPPCVAGAILSAPARLALPQLSPARRSCGLGRLAKRVRAMSS